MPSLTDLRNTWRDATSVWRANLPYAGECNILSPLPSSRYVVDRRDLAPNDRPVTPLRRFTIRIATTVAIPVGADLPGITSASLVSHRTYTVIARDQAFAERALLDASPPRSRVEARSSEPINPSTLYVAPIVPGTPLVEQLTGADLDERWKSIRIARRRIAARKKRVAQTLTT